SCIERRLVSERSHPFRRSYGRGKRVPGRGKRDSVVDPSSRFPPPASQYLEHVSVKAPTLSRAVRSALAVTTTAGLITSIAAVTPVEHFAPGLSFKISSSTRIYAGETPKG